MSAARKRPVVLRPQLWLNTHDAVWSVIRSIAGGPCPVFTTRDIARRVQCGPAVIARYLSRLVTAGIVERVADAQLTQGATYRLLRDMGVEAPRLTVAGAIDTTPTDQERMWQAMKALPTFDVRDIMLSTGITAAAPVKHYLRDLKRAGYLVVVQAGAAGRGGKQARLRLLPSRNTGPRPPAVRRSGAVFDMNQGRQVWPEVTP